MKLNYINIITDNSVWTIETINSLFKKKKYLIWDFNVSFDEKGDSHIVFSIELEEWEDIEKKISEISNLSGILEVKDITDYSKQVRYIFNVNCNCKKTLKKISKDPDKIIETDKELIYVFILKWKNKDKFISELNNLRLPYIYRITWLI